MLKGALQSVAELGGDRVCMPLMSALATHITQDLGRHGTPGGLALLPVRGPRRWCGQAGLPRRKRTWVELWERGQHLDRWRKRLVPGSRESVKSRG